MKMSQKKEMKKKMLVRKTIGTMDKQIKKLEEQKQVYINAANRGKSSLFCHPEPSHPER